MRSGSFIQTTIYGIRDELYSIRFYFQARNRYYLLQCRFYHQHLLSLRYI